MVVAFWVSATASCCCVARPVPGSIAAAGLPCHWRYSLVLRYSLSGRARQGNEACKHGSKCQHVLRHMVRKSAAEKVLIPRAVPSAASKPQSPSLDVSGENDPLYKKNPASLFSTVKRKYPCRDTYLQIMAGGMWPIILFCGGRSVQGLTQKAWPKSPPNQRVQYEQVGARATLQIVSGSFS